MVHVAGYAYPLAAVVPEGNRQTRERCSTRRRIPTRLSHVRPLQGDYRQALEDIPQIQSIVEGALRKGVIRRDRGAVAAALDAAGNGIPTSAADDLMTGYPCRYRQRAVAGVREPERGGDSTPPISPPSTWP